MTDNNNNTDVKKKKLDSSFFECSPTMNMELNPLMSSTFSNITPVYTSHEGYSRIFTAERYGRKYMLKALKPEFLNDSVMELVLAKEFQIGMTLDHPNIRRFIGLENISGLGSTIVLEYIDGDSLRDLIDRGSLYPELARALMSQLRDAMLYLESKQIVHRDLKPANIIVTHIGKKLKLIDFSLSDGDSFTFLKQPAGTEHYIAPEQKKSGATADIRSDIYSFGVIAEEMARSADDPILLRATRTCRATLPEKRPASFADIELPNPALRPSMLDKMLSSRITTAILVIINVAIAAAVAFMS